ncbi:MAG: beta-propeller fold lactonase family protein, partial [Clostridia bacterium]|nr:beta-propeller fold lactonase family protein [Clostridia bacterium]
MNKRIFTGSFMYTGDPGIRCFELDTETGKLTAGEINQDVWNPTYLCINKTRDRLYATSEHDVGEGVPSGVNAFAINADGSLTHLGFAEA